MISAIGANPNSFENQLCIPLTSSNPSDSRSTSRLLGTSLSDGEDVTDMVKVCHQTDCPSPTHIFEILANEGRGQVLSITTG
jgi:hypothetical protein